MYTSDFLVIGSGIAGLNFALRAAEYGSVIILTKKELVESNTNFAQGGIAAVLDQHDSFENHIKDTLKTGEGISNVKAVEILVRYGPQMIKDLLNFGVGFTKKEGKLELAQEGGHSKRRIAFVKDATGKEIERALAYHARHHKNIQIFEEAYAIDLLVKNNTCHGATALLSDSYVVQTFYSKRTIIATGGMGQVYANTSNPKIAAGDGLALAYRAGADLMDIEFVQFHPTTFNKKGYPHYLISETVRGEGGILLNAKGEAFMEQYHPKKELAPRDIVARAIVQEHKKGPVYLDVRHVGKTFLKARFPSIYEQLWWYEIKMEKDLIPVFPAAHYHCGGIKTDTYGQTSITNLFSFGEAACTGVHGANRLASNSLLESLVFSTRAVEKASKNIINDKIIKIRLPHRLVREKIGLKKEKELLLIQKKVQDTMWKYVGIERNAQGLQKALDIFAQLAFQFQKKFDNIINREIIRTHNIILVARIITQAALMREESRGTHFRTDFPKKDDRNWKRNIVVNKGVKD